MLKNIEKLKNIDRLEQYDQVNNINYNFINFTCNLNENKLPCKSAISCHYWFTSDKKSRFVNTDMWLKCRGLQSLVFQVWLWLVTAWKFLLFKFMPNCKTSQCDFATRCFFLGFIWRRIFEWRSKFRVWNSYMFLLSLWDTRNQILASMKKIWYPSSGYWFHDIWYPKPTDF